MSDITKSIETVSSTLPKSNTMDDTESVISKKSTTSIISIKIKDKDSGKPPLSPNTLIVQKKPSYPKEPPKDLDLQYIYKMLYDLHSEISTLRTDMKVLKDREVEKVSEKGSKCLELRTQELKVPSKIAMRCLEYKSLKGEMELFKYCYINDDDKVKVPITCPNTHIFKYWCDNKWNLDVEGEHIKDTLFVNFRKIYLKVNRTQNYEKFDTARFTENQKHITDNLRDAGYQKKFMTALKALLKEI